jgi:hypothetical protein
MITHVQTAFDPKDVKSVSHRRIAAENIIPIPTSYSTGFPLDDLYEIVQNSDCSFVCISLVSPRLPSSRIKQKSLKSSELRMVPQPTLSACKADSMVSLEGESHQ